MAFNEMTKNNVLTMSKWMRFLGIAYIVLGAIYCATIVGIIVGWFPILVGIWTKKSGDSFTGYVNTDTETSLDEAFTHLKNVFVAMGIAMIVGLALMAIYIIVLIPIAIAGGMSGFENLF